MITVHICLNDIFGVAVACEVIFYPGDTPFINGSALAVSGVRSIVIDGDGNGSVMLLPGRYTVRFSRITGNTDALIILVPEAEGEYQLQELICGGNWILPMRDFLQKAKNLGDVADPAAAFAAIKQGATANASGVVQLATQTEVNAGAEAAKAVTPATLAARLAGIEGGGEVLKFITVANTAVRLALTAPQVHVGDLVEQLDTRDVYQVLDTALLDQEAGFVLVGTRAATTGGGGSGGGVGIEGIVAYWRLDEESGVRVDASGNAMEFSDTNGVGFVAGVIGNAANFDGTNYLLSPDLGAITAGFTLALWAKFDPGAQVYQTPDTALPTLATCSAFDLQFALSSVLTGSPVWYLHTGGGLGAEILAPAPTDNGWHHYVLAVDAAGNVAIYIDAVAVASATVNAASRFANMRLGAKDNFFIGAIDEVGLWLRGLTAGEISRLYNGGAGKTYPFN